MEGRQQKLYYFFLFTIALVSVVLLSTVLEPGKERSSGEEVAATGEADKGVNKASAGDSQQAEPEGGKTGQYEEEKGAPGPIEPDGTGFTAGKDEENEPLNPAERRRKTRERLGKQKTAIIETDSYRAKVSDLNAGLVSFQLKGDRYRDENNEPIDVVTTDKEPYFPLAVKLTDARTGESVTGEDRFWIMRQPSKRALHLSLDADGIALARKLEAGKNPYQLWVTTTVANRTAYRRKLAHSLAVHHYVEREEEETSAPFFAMPSAEVSNGLCYFHAPAKSQEQPSESMLVREPREELLNPEIFEGRIHFAGVENIYFLNAMAPHPVEGHPRADSCRLGTVNYVKLQSGAVRRLRREAENGTELGSLFTSRLDFPEFELGPGESRTFRVLAYLGPKLPDELALAGHGLKKSIDFGFFAVISQGLSWLLRVIHDAVGNWGVAIILLTFLVKVVLYPLTAKSLHSMARMKVLKPEMDKINELYKDDREKKSAAIMELYRKHKINPVSGCLPQLLQLPIWIALYTSLRTNVELYHAPFALWWTDLSSPDPYFVLPLALAALMFVQQKMSPPAADPVQAKMMLYMMPTMMGAFMLFLPAGLCLYILTNSVLSIGQQRIIERGLQNVQGPPASGDRSESGAQSAAGDSASSSAGKETPARHSKPGGKHQGRSRSGRKKKTA